MATKIIAHVTDTHLGHMLSFGEGLDGNKMTYVDNQTEHQQNLVLILEDLKGRGIKEMVFGGDIGNTQMTEWFFNLVNQRHFDLQMVLGNHDTFSDVSRYYTQPSAFDTQYLNYTKDDDDFRSIFLDTSDNEIDKARLDWLAEMLETDKKVLLFIHHPVLAVDTPLDRMGAALKGRDGLRDLLKSSGKDVTIFCGHYHMIDEARDGIIRQFTTPAASYQIIKQAPDVQFNQDEFGYRIIEINGDQLKTEVVLLEKKR